jgi:hypothetical protein
MDGRVLTEALGPEYAGGWQIQDSPGDAWSPTHTTTDGGTDARGVQPLTDQDKELIAERLRGLGYVG